jgi:hypothetical protein
VSRDAAEKKYDGEVEDSRIVITLEGSFEISPPQHRFNAYCVQLDCDALSTPFDGERKPYDCALRMCAHLGFGEVQGSTEHAPCQVTKKDNLHIG